MAVATELPEIVQLATAGTPFLADAALRDLLTDRPRKLHPTLGYLDGGSEDFSNMLNQPEYYLARAERRLLRQEGERIVDYAAPRQIVDLGAGGMEKVQILLHEAVKKQSSLQFVPCDIERAILEKGVAALAYFYGQDVAFRPVQGSYEACLDWCAGLKGPRLFTFLGSSYGQLTRREKNAFLDALAATMGARDSFVLALDLEKDPHILEGAYSDSQGHLCSNMCRSLQSLNTYYGANFDIDRFVHRAVYEPSRRAVVEYLVSTVDQVVSIPNLDLEFRLKQDEPLEVEFSEKFVLEEVVNDLARWNLVAARIDIDVAHHYALVLFRRGDAGARAVRPEDTRRTGT